MNPTGERSGEHHTGQSPDFNCWAQGQNVNGVDVWFSVDHNGTTGYYASYYNDSLPHRPRR